MTIKNFVKKHKTAIFTASMIGTGIIIGMHIKKKDSYSEFIDSACGKFTSLGIAVSEKPQMVDITLGSRKEKDCLAFPFTVDEAKDIANDILNACKEVEDEAKKEA